MEEVGGKGGRGQRREVRVCVCGGGGGVCRRVSVRVGGRAVKLACFPSS